MFRATRNLENRRSVDSLRLVVALEEFEREREVYSLTVSGEILSTSFKKPRKLAMSDL